MDNISSITSELLCSSTVDSPNNTTIISKSYSDESNNYWRTEDIPVITDITDISNGPTVQLPNNTTMYATQNVNIP